MGHIKSLTVTIITTFLLIAITPGIANAKGKLVDTCKQITIAGDSEWVPYVIDGEDYQANNEDGTYDLTGIGMELADQILSELDIPVRRTAYSTQLQAIDGMRTGQIDLIVSTYSYDKLAAVAEILQPAWTIDPITVAVRSDRASNLKHWEDLVGQPGIMENAFITDDAVAQYFSKYLHIKNKGTTLEALVGVKEQKFGFIVGSVLQLKYTLAVNRLEDSLVVVSNLTKGNGGVHMAFSKRSPCYQYAGYLRKRLQDHVKSGTVQKLTTKYTQ